MPSPEGTYRIVKGMIAGTEPSFATELQLGIPLRAAPVKITGTSVLTTTTLTAATHASRATVFSSGTSLGLLRHRFKLPAAAAGTSGNTYIISADMVGVPTSNGIVVRPGTTTDQISGTSLAGGAYKGSTFGNRGAYIAMVSGGDGKYYIVGRGVSASGTGTTLQWRTIA